MPTMPQVVGLEYGTAQASLQAAGVLVPANLGYFGTFPITAKWQKSALPPLTVLTQSVAQGAVVAANTAITLGISQPPMGVVFP
jgi:beta-lactam-binding protein with PASTA domain